MFENSYDKKTNPQGPANGTVEKVTTPSGTYEVKKDAWGNEISRRLLYSWEK